MRNLEFIFTIICTMFCTMISGELLHIIVYCMSKRQEDLVLVIRNSEPSSTTPEFHLPEMEAEDHLHQAAMKQLMDWYGIRGKLRKNFLYASPRGSSNRSIIYGCDVESLSPMENDGRIWMNAWDAANVLRSNPNQDYEIFFDTVRRKHGLRYLIDRSPALWRRPTSVISSKRVILMCTDFEGQTLFVKNFQGWYVLPDHTWNFLGRHHKWKKLAKRILAHYGVVGYPDETLSETVTCDPGGNKMQTMFYHVLSFRQQETGIPFQDTNVSNGAMGATVKWVNRECPLEGEGEGKSTITFDYYDRTWINAEQTRSILATWGEEFVAMHDKVMASSSIWRDKMKIFAPKYAKKTNREKEMHLVLHNDREREENEGNSDENETGAL